MKKNLKWLQKGFCFITAAALLTGCGNAISGITEQMDGVFSGGSDYRNMAAETTAFYNGGSGDEGGAGCH